MTHRFLFSSHPEVRLTLQQLQHLGAGQVGDGGFETVLYGTEFGANAIYAVDGVIRQYHGQICTLPGRGGRAPRA